MRHTEKGPRWPGRTRGMSPHLENARADADAWPLSLDLDLLPTMTASQEEGAFSSQRRCDVYACDGEPGEDLRPSCALPLAVAVPVQWRESE